MKKILYSTILCIAFIFLTCNIASAGTDNKIVKVPSLKIVIDGKQTEAKDMPICINQRTLLPYRELLINLGVPNDDQHILWNENDQSITINHGSIKLYMKVNSKIAYVNEKPVDIDVSPVIYNKNVYIPLRFVSDTLGKKVVWNGASNTILLKDIDQYNKIKEIFEKSDAAMKASTKYKCLCSLKVAMAQEQINYNINLDAAGEIDVVNKKMYIPMTIDMLGMSIKSETYYADNVMYTKNPYTGKWEKKTYLEPEYNMLFQNQSKSSILDGSEAIYAGLTLVQTDNSDEIILKGDVFIDSLLKEAMKSESSLAYDDLDMPKDLKSSMEISINKNTYYLNSMKMNVSFSMEENEAKASMNMDVEIKYSDYDGKFEINVPDEVKKEAVETDNVDSQVLPL